MATSVTEQKNNGWWWRKMDARFGFSGSHYLKFEYAIEKYRVNIIFRSDLIKGVFLNNLNINLKYEFAYFFQFHGQILCKINCLTQIWYPFFSITHRFFFVQWPRLPISLYKNRIIKKTVGDGEKWMPDLDSVGKIIYDFTMPFKKIWKTIYFKYIHAPPES